MQNLFSYGTSLQLEVFTVARLTKSEIEKTLLSGGSLSYFDANGKATILHLDDAKQRRLFNFVLRSRVRSPTDLPSTFIAGLQAAFDATHDPATEAATAAQSATQSVGPWKLAAI